MTSQGQWRKNQQKRHEEPIDEESKINFKGSVYEYEFELAMLQRAFINALLFGLDHMDMALIAIEHKLVEAYTDDKYKKDILEANRDLDAKTKKCKKKGGFDSDEYNRIVRENIMKRYHAFNELLFRKSMAPQLAEQGVIGNVR